jgi:universal stress protein A
VAAPAYGERVQHVLCPVDFSDVSKVASDYAVLIGRQFAARVSLLHVAEEPSFGAPGNQMALTTQASTDRQRDLKQQLALFGYRQHLVDAMVSTHVLVVTQQTIVQSIVDAARDLEASLIVMGTRARSGLERFVFGSTTEGVIRHSRIPVLAVPIGAELRSATTSILRRRAGRSLQRES